MVTQPKNWKKSKKLPRLMPSRIYACLAIFSVSVISIFAMKNSGDMSKARRTLSYSHVSTSLLRNKNFSGE